MTITPTSSSIRAYSKLFVGLALIMAGALFCTPMIVNSLSSKASIAKFGKVPLPGAEEEEVKEAKSLPGRAGAKPAVHVLNSCVSLAHGACALLTVKHGDVPDPPPWC